MKEIVEKLVAVERDVSDERGPFCLFGLFLREDMTDRWDLVASAPWLRANNRQDLDYLVARLRSRLDPEEIVFLSRIVVVETGTPALATVHKAITVEHGTAEVTNCSFFGLQIEHAYIITSKRRRASQETAAPQPG